MFGIELKQILHATTIYLKPRTKTKMSDAVVKKTTDDATDLDVVAGDEYIMIDEHERRAHICW